MITTNQIEIKLLEKELTEISQRLRKLGAEMVDIFAKYPKIKGKHGAELKEFLTAHVIAPYEAYYAGDTTTPSLNPSTGKLPDCLKNVILEWAVDDFMRKVDKVQYVMEEVRE